VKTKAKRPKVALGPNFAFGETMKLKKPAYREGIDFDAAYLTATEADELLELSRAAQPPPPSKNGAKRTINTVPLFN